MNTLICVTMFVFEWIIGINLLLQRLQVADRWHLMENASHAFLDAVRKSMRQVRIAIGTATVNPKLLTAAERLQYKGYLRREEANAVIRGLVSEGVSIKEIVRRTGHSRKLVRSVVRGQRTDIFRIRQTSLEPHLPWLEAQWEAGLRNGAELWRQLRLAGFGGGLRVVTEWATRRRRAEKAENGLGHAPAAQSWICSKHVLSERPDIIEIASDPRLDADNPFYGALIPCVITLGRGGKQPTRPRHRRQDQGEADIGVLALSSALRLPKRFPSRQFRQARQSFSPRAPAVDL
ncbi:Hypothetical protein GbCGDNIH9_8649 [Granulibacter bethesdensis]|uniref:Transposase n=1 Tax=Granulibacter bethesdensis TaxID=364410 RepID=A0AAC9P9J7_9PROT|nr:Hypothetical protein GbCGDNIH9_8649 [Granulibacter bethesdensis]APH62685.1 Hypothetical protein GbCGDNIH8_8649 [Granulibacter bethesdensis]